MQDYRDKFKQLDNEISSLKEKISTAKKELKISEKQTVTFLKKCSEYGIKKVSIGKNPGAKWPFGGHGNVFTFNDEHAPNSKGHKTGWPSIWGVCEEVGISTGCGNTDQHNVGNNEQLMEGIYEVKNGKWNRVD